MEARINHIFEEEMKGDTSFKEETTLWGKLFGKDDYSRAEVRDIWHRGVRHGIGIGLIKAGLEGQRVELLNNTTDIEHTKFIEKLYSLCDEYGCYIQYHPILGLTIVSKRG